MLQKYIVCTDPEVFMYHKIFPFIAENFSQNKQGIKCHFHVYVLFKIELEENNLQIRV